MNHGRYSLIAPYRPQHARCWRATEQFNLADLRVHAINDLVEDFRFSTVLEPRLLLHRIRSCLWWWWRQLAALGNEQQLVALTRVIAHSDLIFHPNHIRPIAKAPCIEHFHAFVKLRTRRPHEQH